MYEQAPSAIAGQRFVAAAPGQDCADLAGIGPGRSDVSAYSRTVGWEFDCSTPGMLDSLFLQTEIANGDIRCICEGEDLVVSLTVIPSVMVRHGVAGERITHLQGVRGIRPERVTFKMGNAERNVGCGERAR